MSQTILKKLNEIMRELHYVKKDGKNTFHKYNYLSEAKLKEAIRPLLIERNLVTTTQVVSYDHFTRGQSAESVIFAVMIEFRIYDADDGESIILTFAGAGEDKGDKGLYKAYTGAEKYFWQKLLMLVTGDDPEDDNGQRRGGEPAKSEPLPKPKKPAPDKGAAKTSFFDWVGSVPFVSVKEANQILEECDGSPLNASVAIRRAAAAELGVDISGCNLSFKADGRRADKMLTDAWNAKNAKPSETKAEGTTKNDLPF